MIYLAELISLFIFSLCKTKQTQFVVNVENSWKRHWMVTLQNIWFLIEVLDGNHAKTGFCPSVFPTLDIQNFLN